MDNRPIIVRTHCAKCAKPLPKGRKMLCYECRAKKTKSAPIRYKARKEAIETAAKDVPEYNYAEQGARAEARGISYGRLIYLLENGLPLPPLRQSVRWPVYSKHKGEEQI